MFKYRNSIFPLRCTYNHSSSTVTTNVNSIVLVLKREGVDSVQPFGHVWQWLFLFTFQATVWNTQNTGSLFAYELRFFILANFKRLRTRWHVIYSLFFQLSRFFYQSHERQFHCSNRLASGFRPPPPICPIFICIRWQKRKLSLSFTYFVNLVVLFHFLITETLQYVKGGYENARQKVDIWPPQWILFELCWFWR